MINILFLHTNIPNYVTDGLFHGLYHNPNVTLVDIPRNDVMYTDAPAEALAKTGSRGNTLYGRLKEDPAVLAKRTFWQRELNSYDLILLTDIGNNAGLFDYIYYRLPKKGREKICVIDGYDTPALFPYFNRKQHLLNHRWYFRLPLSRVKLFKREFQSVPALFGITGASSNSPWNFLLKKPALLFPISMSIPEEQIELIPFSEKQKDFVGYHIDPDMDTLFPGASRAGVGHWQPALNSQEIYDNEIRQSRFGITLKRRGWDSLRHYEYAAKGAILCFKDLSEKPPASAPFLLNEHNCIIYKNKEDLLSQINQNTDTVLSTLQQAAYAWVKQFTTIEVARRFLATALSQH